MHNGASDRNDGAGAIVYDDFVSFFIFSMCTFGLDFRVEKSKCRQVRGNCLWRKVVHMVVSFR